MLTLSSLLKLRSPLVPWWPDSPTSFPFSFSLCVSTATSYLPKWATLSHISVPVGHPSRLSSHLISSWSIADLWKNWGTSTSPFLTAPCISLPVLSFCGLYIKLLLLRFFSLWRAGTIFPATGTWCYFRTLMQKDFFLAQATSPLPSSPCLCFSLRCSTGFCVLGLYVADKKWPVVTCC